MPQFISDALEVGEVIIELCPYVVSRVFRRLSEASVSLYSGKLLSELSQPVPHFDTQLFVPKLKYPIP